jgi:hypothetical protein
VNSIRSLIGVLTILLFCCGCDSSSALYPTTGTVMYEDKPVEGANVMFVPEKDGPPAVAVTDASGKFTLTTQGKPGAAAGGYKVTVSKESASGTAASGAMTPDDMKKMQMSGGMKTKAMLPPGYAGIQTTPLKETVKPEKNDFTLTLK